MLFGAVSFSGPHLFYVPPGRLCPGAAHRKEKEKLKWSGWRCFFFRVLFRRGPLLVVYQNEKIYFYFIFSIIFSCLF